jgi:hypothetical protein
MSRLEDRFRDLDRVEVPHLWPEIEAHSSGPPRPIPRSGDRLLAMVLALLVSAGGIGLAAVAFSSDGPRGATAAVTGRADDVGLECEVRLPATEVAPGEAVRATFIYRNVGDETLSLALRAQMSPRFLVRDEAGQLLWDTDFGSPLPWGVTSPYRLEPDAAVRGQAGFTALWGGPLTLEPVCVYATLGPGMRVRDRGVVDLAALQVDVMVPGATPTTSDALERALGETGGLFEDCRPTADGAAVIGSISPGVPDGDLASLEATCRAEVRLEEGFAVVDLVFASPPTLPLPSPSTEGPFRGLEFRATRNPGQVGRWSILVTEASARAVTPEPEASGAPASGLTTLFRAPRDCPLDAGGVQRCLTLVYSLGDRGWSRDQYLARGGLGVEDGVVFVGVVTEGRTDAGPCQPGRSDCFVREIR